VWKAKIILGSHEESMNVMLPSVTQAAIERAREQVISRRFVDYTILFISEIGSFVKLIQGLPVQRKPASLKLALQSYSSDLFDAEAYYYLEHSRDEAELRSRLIALANRVQADVIQERRKISCHEFHCTASGQERTVAEKLKQRVDDWVKQFIQQTEAKTRSVWNRRHEVPPPRTDEAVTSHHQKAEPMSLTQDNIIDASARMGGEPRCGCGLLLSAFEEQNPKQPCPVTICNRLEAAADDFERVLRGFGPLFLSRDRGRILDSCVAFTDQDGSSSRRR
jgi:hypothetical protein